MQVIIPRESLREHMEWWIQTLPEGCIPLQKPTHKNVVDMYTDASLYGWGAHLLAKEASGQWDSREKILHINALEMMAVQNALEAFNVQGSLPLKPTVYNSAQR